MISLIIRLPGQGRPSNLVLLLSGSFSCTQSEPQRVLLCHGTEIVLSPKLPAQAPCAAALKGLLLAGLGLFPKSKHCAARPPAGAEVQMRAGLAAQARPPQRQPFFLIRPPEALGALFCLLATRLQGRRAAGHWGHRNAPTRQCHTTPRHATRPARWQLLPQESEEFT